MVPGTYSGSHLFFWDYCKYCLWLALPLILNGDLLINIFLYGGAFDVLLVGICPLGIKPFLPPRSQ